MKAPFRVAEETVWDACLGIKGTKQTRHVYIAGLRRGLETLELVAEEFGRKTSRRAF